MEPERQQLLQCAVSVFAHDGQPRTGHRLNLGLIRVMSLPRMADVSGFHDAKLREWAAEYERAKDLIAPYLPAFQLALESSQALAKALPPDTWFASAVESVTKAVQFQQQIVQQMALERQFLPVLATHGWLISPLAPADESFHLNGLYEAGGIPAVENYLLGELDNETCEAIVSEITEDRPAFAKWSGTFTKALDAQARGDHELAIPIWLAAIDGICGDELKTFQAYKELKKPTLRKNLKAKLMPTGPVPYEAMLEAWLVVLVGFSQGRYEGGPALLDRDAILHGRRPNIGTRKDAVQCLIALQVLEFLLRLRDQASQAKPIA